VDSETQLLNRFLFEVYITSRSFGVGLYFGKTYRGATLDFSLMFIGVTLRLKRLEEEEEE